MNQQQDILRIFVAALAVIAAIGAGMVLFGDEYTLDRLIETGRAILLAGGGLLLLSYGLNHPAHRIPAIVGMATIIVFVLLLLPKIWLYNYGWPGAIGLLAWTMLTAGGALALSLWLRAAPGWRGAGSVAVVVSIALVACWTAVGLLNGVLFGAHRPPFLWQLQVTGRWIAVYGIIVVACMGRHAGAGRRVQAAGVLAAAVAFTIVVAFTFVVDDFPFVVGYLTSGNNFILPLWMGLTALAVTIAWWNLIRRLPLTRALNALRWLDIGLVAAAGALVTIAMAQPDLLAPLPAMLLRIAGMVSIGAIFGALTLVVLARMNRPGENPLAAPDPFTALTLRCPHCGLEQAVPARSAPAGAASQCAGCRVVFYVRVIEPRCPTCAYRLFYVQGVYCPECGASLPKLDAGAPTTAPASAPVGATSANDRVEPDRPARPDDPQPI